jgi:regulator of replication initiation timing
MAEGGQLPYPGRNLEEENKALRAEIERLRKVLASNGLISASALTHRHNSDLPAVPKQQEGPQERIDMKMCNRCASLSRSKHFR